MTAEENPSLKYIEETGRTIELKFGYFGEHDEPMCAVFADEEMILLMPKVVVENAVYAWRE